MPTLPPANVDTGAGAGGGAPLSVCDAFANGNATTTGPSQEYQISMILTIDAAFEEGPILAEMGNILNSEIAPYLLGCSNAPVRHQMRRQLQMDNVTNIVFSQPSRDETGTYEKR